jgi:hypothetical protein
MRQDSVAFRPPDPCLWESLIRFGILATRGTNWKRLCVFFGHVFRFVDGELRVGAGVGTSLETRHAHERLKSRSLRLLRNIARTVACSVRGSCDQYPGAPAFALAALATSGGNARKNSTAFLRRACRLSQVPLRVGCCNENNRLLGGLVKSPPGTFLL